MEKKSHLIQLSTEDDLQKILDSADQLIIMEFWATWCPSCTKLLPFLEKLASAYQNFIFLQVNVDTLEEIAMHYNVSQIPALVFIKNREIVEVIDIPSEEKIIDALERNKD